MLLLSSASYLLVGILAFGAAFALRSVVDLDDALGSALEAPEQCAAPFGFKGMRELNTLCDFGKGGKALSELGGLCVGKQGNAATCKQKGESRMTWKQECISFNNICEMKIGNVIYTTQGKLQPYPKVVEEVHENVEDLQKVVPEDLDDERECPKGNKGKGDFKVVGMRGADLLCEPKSGLGGEAAQIAAIGSQCVGKTGNDKTCASKSARAGTVARQELGDKTLSPVCISFKNKCEMKIGNVIYTKCEKDCE